MKRIKFSDWMMMTVIMMRSIMMSQSINAKEQVSVSYQSPIMCASERSLSFTRIMLNRSCTNDLYYSAIVLTELE